MSFIQARSFKSFIPAINRVTLRRLSTEKVQKSVFISQSNDVHTNLALEQWINKHYDLQNHHIMLFYKNDPAVVIGRDGNPWLDANMTAINRMENEDNILLARRNGSGMPIYQDRGMMNLTFFGPKEHAEHNYNLGVIARAIFRRYSFKIDNDDEDLTFYNMKISSTGKFMGNVNAYQNCSLLVDVNKENMKGALENEDSSGLLEERKLLNIAEIDNKIDIGGLLSAIGWEYLRTVPKSLTDGGEAFAKKQRGFQMINPTDDWFTGLDKMRETQTTWDQCFGQTPPFTISRSYNVPKGFMNAKSDAADKLQVNIKVNDGIIRDVSLYIPPGLSTVGFTGEAKVMTAVKGTKYTEGALRSIEKLIGLGEIKRDSETRVFERVRQVVSSLRN